MGRDSTGPWVTQGVKDGGTGRGGRVSLLILLLTFNSILVFLFLFF